MKSAMISAVVMATALAAAAPAGAADREPMRKVAVVNEDAVAGEVWMERRGAVRRRGNVRESREYLLADYWSFLGYPHVVVFRREYDCRGVRTRLLDISYHSKDMTPDGKEPGAGDWGVPEGWERTTFDYVCSGTSVSGETEPKDELFEDHLKGN